MQFKKVFEWISDDKPETTKAVIYASSCGVIKCGEYKHWNKKNNGYSLRKERIYPTSYSRGKQMHEPESRKAMYGKGYQHVTIRSKAHSVHRLVALAWIPNPENKKQVNHINGIRDDNRAENLEWVTNQENRDHAKQFHRNTLKGSMVRTAKLTESDVIEIRKLIAEGEIYKKDIAKMFGVGPSTISWISKGGTWKHV